MHLNSAYFRPSALLWGSTNLSEDPLFSSMWYFLLVTPHCKNIYWWENKEDSDKESMLIWCEIFINKFNQKTYIPVWAELPFAYLGAGCVVGIPELSFFFSCFLTVLHGMQDLSSPIRDQICASCTGSLVS